MSNKPPIFQNPQSEGGSFFWEGDPKNNTAILLFHGFTATTVEVRPFAMFLNQQGFSVAGPLLPGHGVSPDELNQVSYKDWIECAKSAYLDLASKYKKVIVVGESMGGLLTLWLGAHFPEICGLLVYAPALRIPRLWQANLVWPYVKYLYKKNIDLETDWQGFNVVPMKAASQVNQFQSLVKNNLKKVNQPIVIFQGKLDATIDPMSSVEVLKNISSGDKELVWLEEFPHCILLEKQLDVVKKISLETILRLCK